MWSYSIISKNTIFVGTIITGLLTNISSNTNSFTEPIVYQSKITPISNSTGIEKSIIYMNISAEITSMEFVEGMIIKQDYLQSNLDII